MSEIAAADHGPIVNKGEDFVYHRQAWRAEARPFDAGGSVGRVVLARRLFWVPSGMVGVTWVSANAQAYGDSEPVPIAGLVAVDFEDGSIFHPEDPAGDHFGLFDRDEEEDTS